MATSPRFILQRQESADPTSALDSIARLASTAERSPEEWYSRFRELLEDGVTMSAVGAVVSGAKPCEACADRFGLRLQFNPHPSAALRQLFDKALPYLKTDKCVAIDLSEAWPQGAIGNSTDSEPHTVLEFPAKFREQLSRQGVRREPELWSLRADHPDLDAFVDSFRTARARVPAMAIRISDPVMAAIRDNGTIPLLHCARPDQRRKSAATLRAASGRWLYRTIDALALWQRLIDTAQRYANVHIVLDGRSHAVAAMFNNEVADCVVPSSLHTAPAESAHVPMEIQLPEFVNDKGRLDDGRLRRAIRLAIRLADNLLEQSEWPTTICRHDAVSCRRLQIRLRGIGNLCQKLKLNPLAFSTLTLVRNVVEAAELSAREASRDLAQQRGPCPELTEQLRQRHGAVAKRLGEELHRGGPRHRSLVLLTPFDMVPGGLQAGYATARAFANLLPVLRSAHTLGFARAPGRLSRFDLDLFVRRAWAYTALGPTGT